MVLYRVRVSESQRHTPTLQYLEYPPPGHFLKFLEQSKSLYESPCLIFVVSYFLYTVKSNTSKLNRKAIVSYDFFLKQVKARDIYGGENESSGNKVIKNR